MYAQLSAETMLLLVTASVAVALALLMWQRRAVLGATPFAWLMLAIGEWALAYVFELGGADLRTKVFWAKVEYLGIVAVPVTWLAFVLRYTGREKWLTRRNLTLLAIIPGVIVFLVWTNEHHGLIWRDTMMDTSGTFLLLAVTHGAAWWVHTVYSYGLFLLGTLFVVQIALFAPRLYRRHAGVLLIGALMPWLGNVLYIFDLNPFPRLDLTPFAFTLTGLVVAWGLMHYRLFDIVPVARDAVIRSMSDSVIVLDTQNRIVDLNPAAEQIIGRKMSEIVGQSAATALSAWPDWVKRCRDMIETCMEIVLGGGDARRTYDLCVSPLYDHKGHLTGRLLVLREITEHKRVEETLDRERKALRLIAEASVHATDVPDLCHRIIAELAETLKFDFGAVRLYDEEQRLLPVTAVVGPSEETMGTEVPTQPFDDPGDTAALVARTRQPLFAPDVSQHTIFETHRARLDELRIGSIIAWPICDARQELLGVIQLAAHTPKRIPEEDRIFFETVAEMFAAVLERKRAEEELRAREQFLALLNDITRAALETPDLATMSQTLADRLGEIIGADGCYITLWDEAAQIAIPMAAYGQAREVYPTLRPRSGEVTITESVLRAGHPLVIEDVFHTSYVSRRIAELFSDRSLLGLPLIAGDEKLGAALIAFNEPHHFTPKEVARGEQAARQIALALAKTRLLEETRRRWREAETLRQAGAAITETLSLDETLDRILEQLERVMHYDSASVQLLRANCLEIVGGRGFAVPEAIIGMRFPVPGNNPNTVVIERREPVIIADVQPIYPEFREPHNNHIHAWLGVPLFVHDRLIGMLAVDGREPGHFNESHARLVIPFANQVAIAIENARLYGETRQRATELATLYEVVIAAVTGVRLDEVLSCTMSALQKAMQADNATILLLEPQSNELVVRAFAGFSSAPQPPRYPIDVGITGWAVRSGQPVLLDDVRTDSRYCEIDRETLSELCAPLRVGDRIIGAINLESHHLAAFHADDLRLLSILAGHLAAVVENSRLFEETERLKVFNEDIVQGVAEAILIEDAQGFFTFANPAAEALLGYTRDELIGLHWSDLVIEEQKEHVRQEMEKRLQSFDSHYETALLAKDGRVVPAIVSARALFADAEFAGSLAAVTDITERKQAEAERERLLRALERRNTQLQTASQVSRAASSILEPGALIQQSVNLVRERFSLYYVGLFLVDQGGEWTGEPGRWAVLRAGTGEAGLEMVRRRHRLEIGGASMIGWCVANKQARIALDVGEEAVRFENPLLPETRSELALPLISRGEVIGAMTIQSTQEAAFSQEDIAVLQVMADQLANAIENVRLYDQVQRELAERRRAEEVLRQYTVELQGRNEELDAFAHTAAHDLKNPLSLLVGYAELVEQDYAELPPVQLLKYLRTIAQNARRMGNIIDELLLLSEVRTTAVARQPLDMGGIVRESQNRLMDMIEQYQAEIILPETWPVAVGYKPWIEEVWANYLSNALKYGGRPPRLELGATVQPGGTVRFWIRDNGPGLMPEEQARLFTPFTRLDQVRAKGHGLGLSIVRRIVEKLGGEVGVESEVGQGSVFTFTLPASKDE